MKDDIATSAVDEVGGLRDSLSWLVRLRWFGVVVVAGSVAVAQLASSSVAALPLMGGAMALAGVNLLFAARLRRFSDGASRRVLEREATAQLIGDLLALTFVLRWSGGVDNPFAAFYVFHSALSAILLPMRRAFVIGAVGVGLHALELVASATGALPHVPVPFGEGHVHEALHGLLGEAENWRSWLFIGSYLAAFVTTQFGVIYLVGTLARRHRDAEEQRCKHRRIARSRERLARLGAMAGGVAHAVRNPLHGVMNCVAILRDAGADAEILQLMEEGTRRIERVTQRLLAFGRDEALRLQPINAGALLDDTVRMVRAAGHARRVVIQQEIPEGPVIFSVDVDRVNEALVNLIDNAVQASPEGGTVTVRLAPTRESVVIEVMDRGSGFPRELRERLFDPFFTTKAVGVGTGLGLAIARAVAEGHGGAIVLDDNPGGGAKVSLVLPRAEAEGDHATA